MSNSTGQKVHDSLTCVVRSDNSIFIIFTYTYIITSYRYEDMYNNPTKGTNSEHRDVVLDILSDARVVGPLMQTGLYHADVNRRNYMYVFGHNSATGPHANVSEFLIFCFYIIYKNFKTKKLKL